MEKWACILDQLKEDIVEHKKKEENFIFGIRAIIEAIEAGKTINKLLIQTGIQGDLHNELKDAIRGKDVLVQRVPIQKLNRLTRKNHQGAIAFTSPIEYHSLENVLPQIYDKGEDPFIFILDRVTDVRNLGSIARSAECNGVHAIVIPSKGSALVSADAVKTSAGALNKIPVCKEYNLKDIIKYLKDYGVKVVGCTEKTEDLLPNSKLTGPIAVVMGSEENGVSPEYLKLCDGRVKIPMFGTIESLNVAVSASVVMYEINRQRASNE